MTVAAVATRPTGSRASITRTALAILISACAVLAAGSPTPAALASVPGHGRALELVTPGDPVSATIYSAPLISPDGTRVVYISLGPVAGAPAGDLLANTLATRVPDGWTSSPMGAPYLAGSLSFSSLLAVVPMAFSESFETSLWLGALPLVPGGPPEGHGGLYRISPGGAVALLVDMGETGAFHGASADTSRAVFSSEDHLLPADSGRLTGRSIYEVEGSTTRLVDQDDDGMLLSACGSAVPSAGGVSRSGARIFFTNPDPADATCPEPRRVYMREGGSSTVDVSASQCTRVDCNGAQDVSFAGATPAGSAVFLTTSQQLTSSDTDQVRDLFRYDVDSGTLVLVSAGPDEAGGEVTNRLVSVSEDGSSVYFYAQGRLLPGVGSEGGENLYLADPAGLHLVAPVGAADPLQISRSGRVALLATAASLDATDVDGRRDVYLYDADADAFTRLSRGASGGNGGFDATIASPIESIGFGLEPANRALSDDGSRAFFSTDEGLLPEDGNGVTDVYEWAGGSLGLVSSGTGSAKAEFAGSSADGTTVLFKTSGSLLPDDRDGGDRDLYAARVGGGFPAAPPAPGCGDPSCAPPRPRAAPAAIVPRVPQRATRRRLRVGPIEAAAGARLAAGGGARIAVRVPVPGRVSAKLTTRLGGRTVTAAAGVAGAVGPGVVHVTLRATRSGRGVLLRQGILRGRLSLSQASLRLSRDLTLRLAR